MPTLNKTTELELDGADIERAVREFIGREYPRLVIESLRLGTDGWAEEAIANGDEPGLVATAGLRERRYGDPPIVADVREEVLEFLSSEAESWSAQGTVKCASAIEAAAHKLRKRWGMETA